MDPQKVGNDLGVRAVLVGRVIQQGDSLTIRTELVMVSDGTELWGQQYNRKFSDVLAVQDQAFVWLEKAREEHSDWLVNLNVDPRLDRLPSDPRFADLVRRIGLI